MVFELLSRLGCVMVCMGLAGCGLLKKKGMEEVIPERVMEVGGTYRVEANTPFYFEDPEAGEPDRFLAEGTRVEYVGPGLHPRSVIVRAGDGMEGFVDVRMLEEAAAGVVSQKRGGRQISGAPELPLPSENGVPDRDEDDSIPRIRTESPRRIAPLPVEPEQ